MKTSSKSNKRSFRNRQTIAIDLKKYEEELKKQKSQRRASTIIGTPRETLNYWRARQDNIPLNRLTIDFLESESGCDFLHRFITALQFVMTEIGGCGIRLVSLVLELTHLNHFVGSSYGTLCQRGKLLEEHIVKFGEEEQDRLSRSMPKKRISIAEDETFHPQPCLVAMEAVSNFILIEQYSEKRDAISWNQAIDKALANLPVEVIQSTSDEAKGIVNHVTTHLGSHHSPDIFHVQYELSKASSAALSSKERHAQKALEAAETAIIQRKAWESAPIREGRGRRPKIATQSLPALEKYREDEKAKLSLCSARRENVCQAKRAIGAVYHPYDLETGQAQDVQSLEKNLNRQFDRIEENCRQSGLADTAMEKIKKAKRMIPTLCETLSFYWSIIALVLEPLHLSQPLERVMREILIPHAYLLSASQKSQTAQKRDEIKAVAENVMQRIDSIQAWQQLEDEKKNALSKISMDCASYFQRSSSCVEGRNGYLSLRHHGLHHLSDRKLKTLTVIHNYFIKRSDNTTAAERFFEQPPKNLFDYLLEKMPYPGYSGKRNKLLKMAA